MRFPIRDSQIDGTAAIGRERGVAHRDRLINEYGCRRAATGPRSSASAPDAFGFDDLREHPPDHLWLGRRLPTVVIPPATVD